MGGPMQERLQADATPALWLPAAKTRSCVGQESRGFDCDSAHGGLGPSPWQRPCSSVYDVDSSPGEAIDESIEPSQFSTVAQRTVEPRVALPPSARPTSSIYSADTSFSIPILWQPDARPCSSIYSVESLSWDELTARVDESVKATQLEAIARLTQENGALQAQLLVYRRSWYEFTHLFGRLLNLTLRIRDILDQYDGDITAVEGAWLARWGITWI
jgi:hypothetical protein